MDDNARRDEKKNVEPQRASRWNEIEERDDSRLRRDPGAERPHSRAARARIRGRLGDHVSWSRRMNWM
jgi:hypothetical protein